MRRTGVAIGAAMLAATVGIQANVERYVGALVSTDNADGMVIDNLGFDGPACPDLFFISELACSLAGREMDLDLVGGSKVAEIYGETKTKEAYYCNFAVNPEYLDVIKKGPTRITGSDAEGEVRVIEYPDHPLFIVTLFVPQSRSTAEEPHPLVNAFLDSVVKAEQISYWKN